jgi:hypothetical protein
MWVSKQLRIIRWFGICWEKCQKFANKKVQAKKCAILMTSSSFDFRVYLKNIFALEPPLKLATFVVEEVIYQNMKKKV